MTRTNDDPRSPAKQFADFYRANTLPSEPFGAIMATELMYKAQAIRAAMNESRTIDEFQARLKKWFECCEELMENGK